MYCTDRRNQVNMVGNSHEAYQKNKRKEQPVMFRVANQWINTIRYILK